MEEPIRPHVLVAEDDAAIRDLLAEACRNQARVSIASNPLETREALARDAFDLLLIDWQFGRPEGEGLLAVAARLQPEARRIVLFTVPTVDALVLAMRAGAHDAWWVARGMEIREGLPAAWLAKPAVPKGFQPLLLSNLAKTLSARAVAEGATLPEARREFSSILLREISRRHGLSRNELANRMGVSLRTIQRLLSDPAGSNRGPEKGQNGRKSPKMPLPTPLDTSI